MAAEAEAAREARAKAIQVICFSLEVFFFFLLVFGLVFSFFLCAFATSSFAIFFKLESTGKGDLGHLFLPRSFSFVSPARFFFLCFVIFNLCLFLFVCFICRYMQHYPLFLPQCFSFSFCFFQFICICDIIICSNSRARAKGDPGLKFEITDDI